MEAFCNELKQLADKHGLILTGTLRVTEDHAKIEPDSFKVEHQEFMFYPTGRDNCGPFIVLSAESKKQAPQVFKPGKAPYVSSDYAPYECPVTGKEIDGRKAHRENLEKTGCRLLEPGEREHNDRARRDADRSLEQEVSNHIRERLA